jgi:hypothetical protein
MPGWCKDFIKNLREGYLGFCSIGFPKESEKFCTVRVLVFALTKVQDGAWLVLVLLPALVYMYSAVHRH